MSYCRAGDDSDVYCYGSIYGGFVTHVAVYPSTLAVAELAGETFRDETLEEFKARLTNLKKLGCLVPDRAFDRIERELKEAKSES